MEPIAAVSDKKRVWGLGFRAMDAHTGPYSAHTNLRQFPVSFLVFPSLLVAPEVDRSCNARQGLRHAPQLDITQAYSPTESQVVCRISPCISFLRTLSG